MNAMAEAKAHALEKEEPVIVHAMCVRMHSHSNSDKHELYRDEAERAEAAAQDPLPVFRKQLLDAKIFTKKELDAINEQAQKELLDAHKTSMKAPNPTPESIYDFVDAKEYVSTKYPEGLPSRDDEEMKFIDALNRTLKTEFRHNPDTFIWGQDMANKDKSSIFNVSKDMQQEFGYDRVHSAPIAEDYILGTANGFSHFKEDTHVVVEGAEFTDYFWPAIKQFVEYTHDY